jgi:hypothetical protein
MTLTMKYHGGYCCGIKVIHGFPTQDEIITQEDIDDGPSCCSCGDPTCTVNSGYTEDDLKVCDAVTSRSYYPGLHGSPGTDFFFDAAPKETVEDRLDRLLAYCRKKFSDGVVEIVLAESRHDGQDQSYWFPVVEARGFKRVNRCKNSNSQNIIHIFHLNVGE